MVTRNHNAFETKMWPSDLDKFCVKLLLCTERFCYSMLGKLQQREWALCQDCAIHTKHFSDSVRQEGFRRIYISPLSLKDSKFLILLNNPENNSEFLIPLKNPGKNSRFLILLKIQEKIQNF